MLEVHGPAPFIFRDTVFSHGWLRLAPFRWDEATATLHRVERLPSGRVVALAVSAPEPEALDTRLRVDVPSDLAEGDRGAVEERVRWIFAVDDDLSAFHSFCAGHPRLRRAGERRQGRILRSPTVFEEVVKTLCCVNARWAQSVRMAERLVAHYGEPHPERPDLRAFPTPAALAAADPAGAQATCRLGYRAARMVEIARREAAGETDLERLRDSDLPAEALLEQLLALPGVGPYAAAHVLAMLGRHEALPLDSWVRETARRGWFRGEPVPDREIAAAFDCYHPFQNLVFRFYDWEGALREEVWHEP